MKVHALLVVALAAVFMQPHLVVGAEIAGDITIFHAGSLAVPFQEIAEAFMETHPRIRIYREAAGSRVSARKISDLGRRCDVMASADYVVIDTLLIPDHASWNIKFAANEMVIAYTDASRYAAEITPDNWHAILLRSDVAYGRSDPNADPCGYRAVLTTILAEAFYDVPGFSERILAKDRRFMRPKETDLLALLETGTIDYVFIYRSVALQHGLRYITLPDEINMKREDLAEHYARASVEISGAAPGETITHIGEPMVYGVTIPHNAPNPDAALAFVAFLLHPEQGRAILERNGQPGVAPAASATYDYIPDMLKQYAMRP